MNLYDIQKKIAQALNHSAEPLIDIVEYAPLSCRQRLDIYSNSITAALIKVLGDTYSICRQLTGDDFFNAMAQIYVKQTPSQTPDIDEYGAKLSRFIRQFPPVESLPYLGDVAELEWAWHQASRAQNYLPLNPADLAQLPEESYLDVIFSTPPGSTLIESDYPIHRIWELHQSPNEEASELNLNVGGVKLFIWRQDLQVNLQVLKSEEWYLLNALQKENKLGNIIEQFTVQFPMGDIAALLAEFMQRGWLGGFTVCKMEKLAGALDN